MNDFIQTIITHLCVMIASLALLVGFWKKQKRAFTAKTGCGGGCGCIKKSANKGLLLRK